jgi:hypothetical protein
MAGYDFFCWLKFTFLVKQVPVISSNLLLKLSEIAGFQYLSQYQFKVFF